MLPPARFYTTKTRSRHSPNAKIAVPLRPSTPSSNPLLVVGRVTRVAECELCDKSALPRLPLPGPQQSARLLFVAAASLDWSFGGSVTEQRVERRLSGMLDAYLSGYSALM